MNWKQMNKWCLEQQGTGYRVSKGWFRSEGLTESELRYTAWGPKPDKHGQREILDIKTSAQEAIAVCEEHRLSQRL